MEIIIYFVTYTLTLLLGFCIGYFKFHEERGTLNSIKIKNPFLPKSIGVVKRPNAEQLRKRGTKEAEEEQEMTDTLNELLK